jgi:uncharacterized protein YkwD
VRRALCAALLVLLAGGLVAVSAAPARASAQTDMLALVNLARAQRGWSCVTLQPALSKAAQSHSREMVTRRFFSHDSPGGVSYAARIRRAGYGKSGYSRWRVGEVLAWGAYSSAAPGAVFRGWMASSAHRAVILDPSWRDAGVGWAEGSYRGLSQVAF